MTFQIHIIVSLISLLQRLTNDKFCQKDDTIELGILLIIIVAILDVITINVRKHHKGEYYRLSMTLRSNTQSFLKLYEKDSLYFLHLL